MALTPMKSQSQAGPYTRLNTSDPSDASTTKERVTRREPGACSRLPGSPDAATSARCSWPQNRIGRRVPARDCHGEIRLAHQRDQGKEEAHEPGMLIEPPELEGDATGGNSLI